MDFVPLHPVSLGEFVVGDWKLVRREIILFCGLAVHLGLWKFKFDNPQRRSIPRLTVWIVANSFGFELEVHDTTPQQTGPVEPVTLRFASSAAFNRESFHDEDLEWQTDIEEESSFNGHSLCAEDAQATPSLAGARSPVPSERLV